MEEVACIEFSFRQRCHHALLRTLAGPAGLLIRVTVMNGELENIIHGHQPFRWHRGYLVIDHPVDDPAAGELYLAIAVAVDRYLIEHPSIRLRLASMDLALSPPVDVVKRTFTDGAK